MAVLTIIITKQNVARREKRDKIMVKITSSIPAEQSIILQIMHPPKAGS
jgi:hypothetical protein